MKFGFIISFLLLSFCSWSQFIKSIDELKNSKNEYKIIFISASWCGVCRSNAAMIENSSKIQEATMDKFVFYRIEEEHPNPVDFENHVFQYVATGLNTGRHNFIDYLLEKDKLVFPSFVVLDPNNYKLITLSGYMDESEWLRVFGTILNQVDEPDSDKSN